MSMQVRPGYVNPLAMMDRNSAQRPKPSAAKQADTVSELQTKQQQLQNQVLLLKASGTDGAGSGDMQKALEARLKEVSAELRTAKADVSPSAEQEPSAARSRWDRYEPEQEPPVSPGIYRVERDGERGFQLSWYSQNP